MAQVFTISDGTTTVNLLNPNGPYYLSAYETGVNQWKDGGLFTNNNFTEGSIPVFRQFDTFSEKITIHVTGATQDAVASNLRTLFDLLESGVKYFLDNRGSQTYISVKGDTESNTRYAVITSYKVDRIPQQFAGPSVIGGLAGSTRVETIYENVDLVIGRGIWLESPPGTLTSAYIDVGPTGQNTTTETIDTDTPLDIHNTNLGGDIEAVSYISLAASTVSDSQNRMLVGIRSYSRGSSFVNILPFSDTGLPTGVTITNESAGTYANSSSSFTGRYLTFTISANTYVGNIVVIGSSVAADFFGRYRCFVRADKTVQEEGRILCKLTVSTSFGSISSAVYPIAEMITDGTDTPIELLDFGVIELPSSLGRSVAGAGAINIRVDFLDLLNSATVGIGVYDVILVPADEAIVEMNVNIGSGNTLIIDKVSSPEEAPDIKVVNSGGNVLYRPIYGGRDLNLPPERSKLYVCPYFRTNRGGEPDQTAYSTDSFSNTFNARVYKLNRYLLPRGNS